MSADQKSQISDSQIDDILAQVKDKRRGESAAAPAAPAVSDASVEAILKGFGLGGPKPSYDDPILLPDPAELYTEKPKDAPVKPKDAPVKPKDAPAPQPGPEPAQPGPSQAEVPQRPAPAAPQAQAEQPAPAQPAEAKSAPEPAQPKKTVQIDVPIDGPVEDAAAPDAEPEPGKKEPITVELPTIKSFTEAEAQRQERERQRIMEEAAREARNTIHSSAQFAVQQEVARQLAAMREEQQEGAESGEKPSSAFGNYSGMRFGDVDVDETFEDFFKKTVAADPVALGEATGRRKGFFAGLIQRIKNRGEDAAEDTAELTDDFDVILPPQGKPTLAASPAQPEEKWNSITLDLPHPKGGGAKMSAAVLAKAIANAKTDDLGDAAKRRGKNVDVPLDEEPEGDAPATGWDEGTPEEYSSLGDAPAVEANLADMRKTRLIRSAVTGAIALVLLYMGLSARAGALPAVPLLDPHTSPLLFLVTNFILLAGAALLSITTMGAGFIGLVREPSTDSFCALAVLAAVVQNVAYLFMAERFDPEKVTLFAPVAALLLFGNALGKWLQMKVICKNFSLVISGEDHAAAFLMPQQQLVKRLCSGLGETDPHLLISRPTALVRGFLRQSFSMRLNDAMAQNLSYVLGGAALVCAVVCGVKGGGVLPALSGLAAAACMGAPLASTLVYAVPAKLMQDYAGRQGAVIPGPSAVDALGRANTVLLNAGDLFPVGSVRLHGIKTFEKERIDIAILYAASLLAKNCKTLRDIFLAIIQGNEKLLYPVESLTVETGYGLMGWIEHNRVMIGNREMMARHDIELPSMDYEKKYTKDGRRAPIYLAVAGKLFGLFVVSYQPNAGAGQILDRLARSGTSVLVQSDDFNVTSQLVSVTYRIPLSMVKVLSQPECDAMTAQTGYRAESDGVMIHTGSCASFLGGMRAAACAADGERLARVVQAAAILLSALFSLALAFYAGLGGLALGAVLLYQFAWCLLTVAVPLSKRP